MDRMCIYLTLVFVFVLHVQVEGGDDPCDVVPLNTRTQVIIDAMTSAGVATQNPSTLIVTVVEGKLPQMLDSLCTSSIRAEMLGIQNLIAGCPQLLQRIDSKLYLIQIKGLALAQLFIAFTSVDNFCNCQSHLPMAWTLKETVLTHTDNSSLFQTIADVGEICSDVTKGAITTIAGFETTHECANPIANQAGFDTTEKKARLASLKEFVDQNCANFDADKWSCVTEQDSMGDVSNCMTSWASQQPQTKIDCARYDCVEEYMKTCTADARRLYIKAVNAENTDAIKMDKTGCDGAAGVQISLLVLVACFILNRFK